MVVLVQLPTRQVARRLFAAVRVLVQVLAVLVLMVVALAARLAQAARLPCLVALVVLLLAQVARSPFLVATQLHLALADWPLSLVERVRQQVLAAQSLSRVVHLVQGLQVTAARLRSHRAMRCPRRVAVAL